MTQRPWLAHYPSDVAHELVPPPFETLPGLIATAVAEYGDTIAFTQCMPNGMNGSLTYREVDELSDAFAAYLREEVGLGAGDRVAVQMPNCLSYPVVAFGVLKAGCVLVNTNPLYTASEMTHQFSDSGATVLVIIDMFADRLPEVLAATGIETVVTVRISEFFPPVVAGVIRLVQSRVHTQHPRAVPASPRQPPEGVREVPHHVDDRGQHALQRPPQRALVP